MSVAEHVLTKAKMEGIIHDAARACGMDGHIDVATAQANLGTQAEMMMGRFGSGRMPHKNSYLYLDSVDACFYISRGRANCTFTARWFSESKDLDRLAEAGALVKKMLQEMQRRIDAVGEEAHHE